MPRQRSNRTNGMRRTRRPRGRNNNTAAKSAASNAIITQPRYKPVVNFSRTVTRGFEIATDGINPTLGAYTFTFDQLPNYTEFTSLFLVYRLNKIKIVWKPEYTELTDAALVSNAVNVNFNTAIDQTNSNAPGSVDEILQYQSCKSTGITKQHSRNFQPAMITESGMPCHCYISCLQPSVRHYGLKYGIPPTGVAMLFNATVTFSFSVAGSA
jgi:hypothetical protein